MATRDCPAHYPYSFKALLDVPRRLFHPPPAKVKVGRVRSMSLTPLFEVKLADVLGESSSKVFVLFSFGTRRPASSSVEQEGL